MGTFICALMCGANVFMMGVTGLNPWNLASAVVCGLLTIACAVMDAS